MSLKKIWNKLRPRWGKVKGWGNTAENYEGLISGIYYVPSGFGRRRVFGQVPLATGYADLFFSRFTGDVILDKTGYLKAIGRDVPSIGYDIDTKRPYLFSGAQGLNNITKSNDFSDNAIYGKSALLLSTFDRRPGAPDGSDDAWFIYNYPEAYAGGYSYRKNSATLYVNLTNAPGKIRCFSIFLKRGDIDGFIIRNGQTSSTSTWDDTKENAALYKFDDLEKGIYTPSLINKVSKTFQTYAEKYADGWFRVNMKIEQGGSETVHRFYIDPLTSPEYDFSSLRPDNKAMRANSGFFIWGAQHEDRLGPTPYIPTNGTTMTKLVNQYSYDKSLQPNPGTYQTNYVNTGPKRFGYSVYFEWRDGFRGINGADAFSFRDGRSTTSTTSYHPELHDALKLEYDSVNDKYQIVLFYGQNQNPVYAEYKPTHSDIPWDNSKIRKLVISVDDGQTSELVSVLTAYLDGVQIMNVTISGISNHPNGTKFRSWCKPNFFESDSDYPSTNKTGRCGIKMYKYAIFPKRLSTTEMQQITE